MEIAFGSRGAGVEGAAAAVAAAQVGTEAAAFLYTSHSDLGWIPGPIIASCRGGGCHRGDAVYQQSSSPASREFRAIFRPVRGWHTVPASRTPDFSFAPPLRGVTHDGALGELHGGRGGSRVRPRCALGLQGAPGGHRRGFGTCSSLSAQLPAVQGQLATRPAGSPAHGGSWFPVGLAGPPDAAQTRCTIFNWGFESLEALGADASGSGAANTSPDHSMVPAALDSAGAGLEGVLDTQVRPQGGCSSPSRSSIEARGASTGPGVCIGLDGGRI